MHRAHDYRQRALRLNVIVRTTKIIGLRISDKKRSVFYRCFGSFACRAVYEVLCAIDTALGSIAKTTTYIKHARTRRIGLATRLLNHSLTIPIPEDLIG